MDGRLALQPGGLFCDGYARHPHAYYVAELRGRHAIYLAPDGRANLAGPVPDTIDRFASGVRSRVRISI